MLAGTVVVLDNATLPAPTRAPWASRTVATSARRDETLNRLAPEVLQRPATCPAADTFRNAALPDTAPPATDAATAAVADSALPGVGGGMTMFTRAGASGGSMPRSTDPASTVRL